MTQINIQDKPVCLISQTGVILIYKTVCLLSQAHVFLIISTHRTVCLLSQTHVFLVISTHRTVCLLSQTHVFLIIGTHRTVCLLSQTHVLSFVSAQRAFCLLSQTHVFLIALFPSISVAYISATRQYQTNRECCVISWHGNEAHCYRVCLLYLCSYCCFSDSWIPFVSGIRQNLSQSKIKARSLGAKSSKNLNFGSDLS